MKENCQNSKRKYLDQKKLHTCDHLQPGALRRMLSQMVDQSGSQNRHHNAWQPDDEQEQPDKDQTLGPILKTHRYLAKSWKIIRIETIEMASTKINMIAMPMNIFDAADGFLLSALMTA
jgi:hypothetical protein